MKKALLLFFAFVVCLKASAQSNFYKISMGGGAGITQSFADLKKNDFGLAVYGTADYYFTPFLSLGGELQMGQINGGDVNTDPHERQFINDYKTGTLNGKIYLGALLNFEQSTFANIMKWGYVGGGVGLIANNMKKIARIQASTGYRFPGKDNSKNLLFPLNVGINYYFKDYAGRPKIALNLNYQANFTIGEGLDGYDDSAIRFKAGSPDVYTFVSLGIKYQFGPVGLSRKTLY